jgi:hypothetical protein
MEEDDGLPLGPQALMGSDDEEEEQRKIHSASLMDSEGEDEGGARAA